MKVSRKNKRLKLSLSLRVNIGMEKQTMKVGIEGSVDSKNSLRTGESFTKSLVEMMKSKKLMIG